MVADVLLSLYQNGWQPMAPLDRGLKKQENLQSGPEATVCFRKKEKSDGLSSASSIGNEDSCICLETYGSNYLGFHEAPNTILHDIVTTLQSDYKEGIAGVSNGVASVIRDYIEEMPQVLPTFPDLVNEKYIQLGGNPWSSEDAMTRETLQMSIVACLTKEGYRLSIDITMDATSRVFFFIKNNESNSNEVLIPDMAKSSNGESNRPTLFRSKSSFFRNYNGRLKTTRKRANKASLRRKAIVHDLQTNPKSNNKPKLGELAWWQQASTDVSSDQEDDELSDK